MTSLKRRQSKYTLAVRSALMMYGHATNAEILDEIRKSFPLVSDTTIHRITQRMLEDNEITLAPFSIDSSMVFDTNVMPHDHFECESCGMIRDILLSHQCRQIIRTSVGSGVRLGSSIKIQGNCENCNKRRQ
ncbi:transcriptional repressor [Candidatus Saccharibacteria bacterium]|jgi:Fe2+ or Zn2+ uptake regulation protein|nr:transcriptional repressor [Candidatus Saccharibacteria bacterium]